MPALSITVIRFKLSRRFIIIATVALLAMGGIGYFYYKNTSDLSGMISTDIRSVADFTIYMPQKLPQGFGLSKESVAFRDDILFMQFVKGDQVIFLSQQEKPNSMPPISSLKGFSELPVDIGYAVTGEQEGTSAVIINTDSSIITITGGETVSRSELGLVAKRLKPID